MRELTRIVIHCTATLGDARGDVDVATVRRWHTSPPRNWSDIGYHFLVRQDGTIETGRPVHVQGAHTRGQNADTIGVAFSGGINPLTRDEWDTRTPEQRKSLKTLLNALLVVFPSIQSIHGHNEFSAKACPCFDAFAEYRSLTHGEEPEPRA